MFGGFWCYFGVFFAIDQRLLVGAPGVWRRSGSFEISTTFPCSVEDCSLAVAGVVGHSSIRSAARMNGGVVIFVDSVAKANKVVESGIVVKDLFVSVSPLTTPAARFTISNIPPFIGDEVLVRELSRHGMCLQSGSCRQVASLPCCGM